MTDQPTQQERPSLPPLPEVVDPGSIDRESAVEAEGVAVEMIADLSRYLDDLAPCVEADPPVMDVGTLEALARIRRQVGTATDLIVSRKYSATATEYARTAARLGERIAGLALIAGERAGILDDPAALFGRTVGLLRTMGDPTDEEFAAALVYCRARTGSTRNAVADALAADDLGAAEELERKILGKMAKDGHTAEVIADTLGLDVETTRNLAGELGIELAVEPVDTPAEPVVPGELMPRIIGMVADAGAYATIVTPNTLAGVPQSQAADWAKSLFTHAKHVLALRGALLARAAEK